MKAKLAQLRRVRLKQIAIKMLGKKQMELKGNGCCIFGWAFTQTYHTFNKHHINQPLQCSGLRKSETTSFLYRT